LLNSETVAFQLDSSEQGYFPDPSSLRGGSGNETRKTCEQADHVDVSSSLVH